MNPLTPIIWESPPPSLVLEHNEVHLWRVQVIGTPERTCLVDKYLSEAEVERGRRYYFDHDRDQFLESRISLRIILGQYLDLSPAVIEFGRGSHGKPNLKPLSSSGGLSFNLSHSGEIVLIAVGRNREIGVDVEQLRREIDLEGIAQRFFSPREVKELFALSPELRPGAFFRCWTRKEAYVKARGRGLSIPLNQFDVTLEPEVYAALQATRDYPDEAEQWALYNVDLGEDYQAALVVDGVPEQIRFWKFKPESMPIRANDESAVLLS